MSLNNIDKSNKTFAIPSGYDAYLGVSLALFCGLFFFVVFGGASFLSEYIPWRLQVSFDFENSLPFIPLASLVYLSLLPLLGLSLFILRPPKEVIPLFWVFIFEIIVAGFFFIVIPLDTSYPERKAHGVSGFFFDLADIANMNRNFFPSLHVCFSFTAAFFYSSRMNNLTTVVFLIWALAISVSTLLIHEHYIIDIIGGFFLALFSWQIVGKWAKKEEVIIATQKRVERYLPNLLKYKK